MASTYYARCLSCIGKSCRIRVQRFPKRFKLLCKTRRKIGEDPHEQGKALGRIGRFYHDIPGTANLSDSDCDWFDQFRRRMVPVKANRTIYESVLLPTH